MPRQSIVETSLDFAQNPALRLSLGAFPFRSRNQSNIWDNSVMNPELAAQYRDLLSETQREIRDRAWVRVLQQWTN
jgi:hypothetical protein